MQIVCLAGKSPAMRLAVLRSSHTTYRRECIHMDKNLKLPNNCPNTETAKTAKMQETKKQKENCNENNIPCRFPRSREPSWFLWAVVAGRQNCGPRYLLRRSLERQIRVRASWSQKLLKAFQRWHGAAHPYPSSGWPRAPCSHL